jgi:hypothetical protein
VIVAVITVRMVQPAVHEIVDMIAMRDDFMSASRPVLVGAASFGRATRWVFSVDRDDVLIDVIFMHVVKVALMQVVHMALVPDRGVPAVRPMFMSVVLMMLFVASHDRFPLSAI